MIHQDALFSLSILFTRITRINTLLILPYELPAQKIRNDYSAVIRSIYCPGDSPILTNAWKELQTATGKALGVLARLTESIGPDGVVLLGTVRELRKHLSKSLAEKVEAIKDEGCIIESIRIQDKKAIVITSNTEVGVLYGVFHFLRLMQTCRPIDSVSTFEEPAIDLKMLNHWDLLNGSIIRAYAGKSKDRAKEALITSRRHLKDALITGQTRKAWALTEPIMAATLSANTTRNCKSSSMILTRFP